MAFTTAFILGFFVRPAIGMQTLVADGAWWDTISSDMRVSVVTGMLDSYRQGFSDGQTAGYMNGIIAAAGQVDKKTANKLISWTVHTNESKVLAVISPAFPKSFDTYADEITDFYRDHPDVKTRFTVGQIVGCESDPPMPLPCERLAEEAQ